MCCADPAEMQHNILFFDLAVSLTGWSVDIFWGSQVRVWQFPNTIMRGSRKCFQRGSNFDNVFFS